MPMYDDYDGLIIDALSALAAHTCDIQRQPSKRGVGLSFGPDVTEKFLALNNLKMVVRSHEVSLAHLGHSLKVRLG